MLESQGSCCVICRDPFGQPYVDHNHATGAVRALLCQKCNTLLGMARESPIILSAAIGYLEAHRG